MQKRYLVPSIFLFTLALAVAAQAAPAERLLPQTTKGMIAIRDVSELADHWSQTQLGQLVDDPAMKPFVEDVQRQVKAKLAATGARLGIRLGELGEVCTGGAAVAQLQPGGDKSAQALLLIADATGSEAAAEQLMFSTAHRLGGGQWVNLPGVRAVRVKIAGTADRAGHEVFFCVSQGQLVACDNSIGLLEVVATLKGQSPSLAEVDAFRQVMERVEGKHGDIIWFVDLFGYMELLKARGDGDGKTAELMAAQGFAAIKGIGGQIQLATDDHEILHRSYVYVPRGTAKLERAAKLLSFINTARTSQPLAWMPSGISNHLQVSWDMQAAFQGVKPLVGAITDDENIFDEILDNIANDPNGPKLDIRRDVVPNLGTRISLISDHMLPITPDSERMLIAVEVKDEHKAAASLAQWLRTETKVQHHLVDNRDVWEFVPVEEQMPELALEIEGGFDFETPVAAPAPAKDSLLPHAALTIANGHLLISTHIDYLTSILQRPANKPNVEHTTDFRRTRDALEKLGGGHDTTHLFTRLAGALEVTYELTRTGRLPESKSMLGLVLNLIHKDDSQRAQEFDGSKMPAFQSVAKYLGPHGMFVQTEDHGWYVAGCLLNSQAN